MARFTKEEHARVATADQALQELINCGLVVTYDGKLKVDWNNGNLIEKRREMLALAAALTELHSSLLPERFR